MGLDDVQKAVVALMAIAGLLGGGWVRAQKALRLNRVEMRRAQRQEKLDGDSFAVFHEALASMKAELDWVRQALEDCHEREGGLRVRLDLLEARVDRQDARSNLHAAQIHEQATGRETGEQS